MWLNGEKQWDDHELGKKHTKNMRRRSSGQRRAKDRGKDRGIVVPWATVLLIEQEALHQDAVWVKHYLSGLLSRIVRSRL